MKVVYKFVLRAYVGPMVMTFFIVMFILLMHYLWMHIDELVGKGLSLSVILELIMYATANLIPMGLPLATLLASIMTMGNLGENNELLALKAAGISLLRITRPLQILMIFVSVGSFFVINDLTPYSYKKMHTLITDISKQRQEMKFTNGIFFNGIPNMSIRVESQDSETQLLTDVLIYDNSSNAQMRTTVADSGYIRISEDKKYLEVDLYSGEVYEENRNNSWYNNNILSHHTFDEQVMLIPVSGFAMERSELDAAGSRSEAKNITQLSYDIDSLRHRRDSLVNRFANSFTKNYIFKHLNIYSAQYDSLPSLQMYTTALPSIDTMSTEERQKIYTTAKNLASEAQSYVRYESKYPVYTSNMLYRAQGDYQRKLSLPFSIMIFFLIGSALGAIIRKGGIGMPIVVSVIFFIVYFMITTTGDRFVKEGSMHPFLGIWLSSIILLPIAIFLTIKSTNDSAILDREQYIKVYKRIKSFVVGVYRYVSGLFTNVKQKRKL